MKFYFMETHLTLYVSESPAAATESSPALAVAGYSSPVPLFTVILRRLYKIRLRVWS